MDSRELPVYNKLFKMAAREDSSYDFTLRCFKIECYGTLTIKNTDYMAHGRSTLEVGEILAELLKGKGIKP